MNLLYHSLRKQMYYLYQKPTDMLNMLLHYHNRLINIPNKHNLYQLIYDDKNMLGDNQQLLLLVMQAFYELLYRLNKAKVNIVINHWDQVHVNRYPMLNHLGKIRRIVIIISCPINPSSHNRSPPGF
jgi:hypothetical protein